MTNPLPYLFWITSRASGIAALVLASLAVGVGLSMQARLLKSHGKPRLRVVHESLSLACIAALVVHGTSLLGDSYLHPSLADVTLPFVSPYKTIWTSLGILGGWGLTLLGLSYYARARIGVARWRTLHRFTALAWIAGLVHSLGEGSDSGQIWFLALVTIVVLPALGLLALRIGAAAAPIPGRRASPRHTGGQSYPGGARTLS